MERYIFVISNYRLWRLVEGGGSVWIMPPFCGDFFHQFTIQWLPAEFVTFLSNNCKFLKHFDPNLKSDAIMKALKTLLKTLKFSPIKRESAHGRKGVWLCFPLTLEPCMNDVRKMFGCLDQSHSFDVSVL